MDDAKTMPDDSTNRLGLWAIGIAVGYLVLVGGLAWIDVKVKLLRAKRREKLKAKETKAE